jgi:hypothetical protein
MIDVWLPVERDCIRLKVLVELKVPPSAIPINEVYRTKVPGLAIPSLVKNIPINNIEKSCGADSLAARPPIAVANAQ